MPSSKIYFEVEVPCSTANLGPGFDSIGMALNLNLRMRFSPSDQLRITTTGPQLEGIALDEDNLIVRVIAKVFNQVNLPLPSFHLNLESEIPMTRGLGSSAAAIVGGLVAANHMLGSPWNLSELLHMALEWEGHPDNVGASLYGGVVIGSWDGRKAHIICCEPPDLPVIAVVPRHSLSTKLARSVLPDTYRREDAILASSRANLLVAALTMKRWDLLSVAMQDGFHQPYREELIPGLKQVLAEAVHYGAMGVSLSGAGPTIFSFAEDQKRLKKYFVETFSTLKIPVDVMELRSTLKGASVRLTLLTNHSKVVGNEKGAKIRYGRDSSLFRTDGNVYL